jgi:hypothetical protein
MNSASSGSHGDSGHIVSEESDSSIDNDSVFSISTSLPSTTTLGSVTEGIDTLLIQAFAALLYQDGALISLISTAVSNERIGFERMRNNFRKLLKQYAGDLKEEMSNDRHPALVGFVSTYSTKITRELFSKPSIDDQEAKVLIPAPMRKPHAIKDRRKKVEEFLHKTLGHAEPAESTKPDGPNGPSKLNKPNELIEPNEDSDQDSVAEAGEEEPYDGSLKRLDQMQRFILESVAFQTLRRRLHDFVYPSLRSRLRDLVTVWSRPDHKYYGHVTRYKLSNLVAELQYIHPREIRFDRGKGAGHNLRRVTSYCQNVVECWTGESWDWWPLPQCSRPLEEWETRVRWQCVSGPIFRVLKMANYDWRC